MKILELSAQNVKRLKAVHIRPDPTGNLVVIGGENEQGKSSVLDSIMYAIGGKSVMPDEPLRRGAASGSVTLDLGGLLVTRTFSPGGKTTVKVIEKGTPTGLSAQKLLDSLMEKIGFDPTEFARMKDSDRVDVLQRLTGINPAEYEAAHKKVYDERTAVNRDVKNLTERLKAMVHHGDAPAKEIDVAALAGKIDTIEKAARVRMHIQNEVENLVREESRLMAEIERLTGQLAQVRTDKGLAETKLKETPEPEPTEALKKQITDAQELNRKLRENAMRADVVTSLTAKQAESDKLTAGIEELALNQQMALAKCQLPVDGLAFTMTGVSLKTIPFDQCSSAEKLRASVQIGMALNPKLRVMLCRDGAFLDNHSLQMLASIAHERDYQLWIERVGKGIECSVIIDDGTVSETRHPGSDGDREQPALATPESASDHAEANQPPEGKLF